MDQIKPNPTSITRIGSGAITLDGSNRGFCLGQQKRNPSMAARSVTGALVPPRTFAAPPRTSLSRSSRATTPLFARASREGRNGFGGGWIFRPLIPRQQARPCPGHPSRWMTQDQLGARQPRAGRASPLSHISTCPISSSSLFFF